MRFLLLVLEKNVCQFVIINYYDAIENLISSTMVRRIVRWACPPRGADLAKLRAADDTYERANAQSRAAGRLRGRRCRRCGGRLPPAPPPPPGAAAGRAGPHLHRHGPQLTSHETPALDLVLRLHRSLSPSPSLSLTLSLA